MSSYYKTHRCSREFDDLYDVSGPESDEDNDVRAKGGLRPTRIYSTMSKRDSWSSAGNRNRYPSLVIPSARDWPTINNFHKNSAVPPTPPPKIPISPAVLSLIVPPPESTAPPSLDGSLNSDQLAASSAPPTPQLETNSSGVQAWGQQVQVALSDSDYEEDVANHTEIPAIEIQVDEHSRWALPSPQLEPETQAWALAERAESLLNGPERKITESEMGVQLPASALDTLRHLFLDSVPDVLPKTEEMQEISIRRTSAIRKATRSSINFTPVSETSAYSFSDMSIPSPGGFFSSLDAGARHTWCAFKSGPDSAAPPSSTTAEQFYNAPWNVETRTTATVKCVVEVDDDVDTVGPPTARQISFNTSPQPTQLPAAVVQNEPLDDYDEQYVKEIWHSAEDGLDRTSLWLAEQTSYMAALRETNPENKIASASTLEQLKGCRHERETSLDSPMKKAVKFLDTEDVKIEGVETDSSSKAEPVFYQAFQHVSNTSSPTDSFIHRQARYDAVQVSRASLAQEHVDQLLGNFHTTSANRPAPSRPISMMPGKSEVVEQTAEQRVIARVERERQALEQVTVASWVVDALKYLSGGRLLNSPVTKVLSQAASPGSSGSYQARLLDLGGQPKCDWAWHCCRELPSVKIYTATCDQRAAASNLRGPSNHRSVSVAKLWELPFPDGHFDAISARSLFTFLKNEKPLGEAIDEYDACLRECMRCLKPGGYLEFFVLDSEIVHSGPRGTAASVEFGFNLKARGYDPAPTKGWLGRVRRAGFVDIKRAWTFLPMGVTNHTAQTTPETPPPNASIFEENLQNAEAVQGPVGSSADTANISGLVGSWAWEQWMLKLQMEMGKENLLEGVGAVIEEGKSTGAGWRCLSGWARKST